MKQLPKSLYEQQRHLFGTGDIVLFSGKSFVSRLIQISTQSEYSHVGMVIRSNEHDCNLLWESTTLSKSKDIFTGKAHRGVALVSLSERLAASKGKVVIRRLEAEKGSDQMKRLTDLRQQLRGASYEEDVWELIRSSLSLLGNNKKEDLTSVFCSEMVAEAYQRAGWLDKSRPSNSYVPAHFSEKHSDGLILLNGAKLGSEIIVKND